MSDAKNPWSFLGYDLRQVVSPVSWKLAWEELFFEKNRFFHPYICEVVKLVTVDGKEMFIRQDDPVTAARSKATALLLPPEQYLIRELVIPAVAEANLYDIVSLDVLSNSPFPAEETRYGWRITKRGEGQVELVLAITSTQLVHHAFFQSNLKGSPAEYEIWCAHGTGYIEISGYLEHQRIRRQKKKIAWLLGKFAAVTLLLMFCSMLPAGFKLLEMQAVRSQFLAVNEEAAESVRLREELVANNNLINNIKTLPASSLDPLQQLEHLTRSLPDDVFLKLVEMTPVTIRITGQADRAAELMQDLNADEAYERVTAPAAISINRASGKEQFTLDIRLPQRGGA